MDMFTMSGISLSKENKEDNINDIVLKLNSQMLKEHKKETEDNLELAIAMAIKKPSVCSSKRKQSRTENIDVLENRCLDVNPSQEALITSVQCVMSRTLFNSQRNKLKRRNAICEENPEDRHLLHAVVVNMMKIKNSAEMFNE